MRTDQASFRRFLANGSGGCLWRGSSGILSDRRSQLDTEPDNRSATEFKEFRLSDSRYATLRANYSTEGSRVALTANQSLLERLRSVSSRRSILPVRIPAADAPRPEAVRGRAFGDVKVQRGASLTRSFRSDYSPVPPRAWNSAAISSMWCSRCPGRAQARQRRRVAMLFATTLGLHHPRQVHNDAETLIQIDPVQVRLIVQIIEIRMSDPRQRQPDRRQPRRAGASPKPSPTPSAKPAVSPSPSATPRTSPVVARSSPSPAATASSQQPAAQGTTWSQLKQKARYWILLAQLNPVPVGIGVGVFAVCPSVYLRCNAAAPALLDARDGARSPENRESPKRNPNTGPDSRRI